MKSRRKDYLINPKFQLRFSGYFISFFLITIMIFIGTINFFFWKFKQIGIEVNLPPNHVFFTFINEQQVYLNLILSIVGLVVLVVMSIGGILLSHKIAGPLYRFCQDLKKLEKNNLKEIKFRKGDFFLEVSEEFNKFLERINK